MKKLTILFAIIISLCINSSIQSQHMHMFGNKGTWEFGGVIGWSSITPVVNGTSGTATSIFLFQPIAGYFIVRSIEIAIEPSILTASSNGNSSTSMTWYLAPGYNFKLSGSKIFPAVHLLIGYSSTSSTGNPSASGFSFGAAGGVKMNLLGNSLLDIGLQYQNITTNPSGASNRFGQNIITVGAGWSVFF